VELSQGLSSQAVRIIRLILYAAEFYLSDPRIAMVFDGGTTWDLIEDCPQDCLLVSFAAHPMAWMHDRSTE